MWKQILRWCVWCSDNDKGIKFSLLFSGVHVCLFVAIFCFIAKDYPEYQRSHIRDWGFMLSIPGLMAVVVDGIAVWHMIGSGWSWLVSQGRKEMQRDCDWPDVKSLK